MKGGKVIFFLTCQLHTLYFGANKSYFTFRMEDSQSKTIQNTIYANHNRIIVTLKPCCDSSLDIKV